MRKLIPAAFAVLFAIGTALAGDILSVRMRTEPTIPYVGEDFKFVLEVSATPGSEIRLIRFPLWRGPLRISPLNRGRWRRS